MLVTDFAKFTRAPKGRILDSEFEFQDLDHKIIAMLKEDGRASNQTIANALDVTTSVVATRIKRMEEAKALKIVAVSDFSALNYNILLTIGVDVKGRRADDVAADIGELDQVVVVQTVSGKHDIEILVALEDISDMSGFLLNKLSKIKGIRSLDSGVAVDIIKYNFDVAPI